MDVEYGNEKVNGWALSVELIAHRPFLARKHRFPAGDGEEARTEKHGGSQSHQRRIKPERIDQLAQRGEADQHAQVARAENQRRTRTAEFNRQTRCAQSDECD